MAIAAALAAPAAAMTWARGSVMLPAAHIEPGVVESHASKLTGIIDVGRYPSGGDELQLAPQNKRDTFGCDISAPPW